MENEIEKEKIKTSRWNWETAREIYTNKILQLEIREGLEILFDNTLADQPYDSYNLRFVVSNIMSILLEESNDREYKHEINEKLNHYKIVRLR